MRGKVIAFVEQTIENQKKSLKRIECGESHFTATDKTQQLYADQYARSREVLELWEAMLNIILGMPVAAKVDEKLVELYGDAAPPEPKYDLSRRELLVLDLLSKGEPNKIIAHKLDIVESTVKVHVRTILRKLKVHNRNKAGILARLEGLV